MTQQTLYQECPLCIQGTVSWHGAEGFYRCDQCGLTLKERALLGIFKKDHFSIADLGEGDFELTRHSLAKAALTPERLKVVLGNVYTDPTLAEIAEGGLAAIRPVRTVLAQIILEQLNEECYIQVNGLRRGNGPPLSGESNYRPNQAVSRSGMDWQDEGNLFGTTHRLVFPSDQFTFIRLDRKIIGIQAFTNGVAVQRKGEAFATYFVGCYPHEAALVAAFVMAKVPAVRPVVSSDHASAGSG